MKKNDNANLIKLLAETRLSKGLSIRSLATVTGISFSTLSRLERGESAPDLNTKVRIINWLTENGVAHEISMDHSHVADVHFRAAKEVDSKTVKYLVEAAKLLRSQGR